MLRCNHLHFTCVYFILNSVDQLMHLQEQARVDKHIDCLLFNMYGSVHGYSLTKLMWASIKQVRYARIMECE